MFKSIGYLICVFLCCVLTLCLGESLIAQQNNNANAAQGYQLPKSTMKKLEKVVLPAWQSGDAEAFMDAVMDLIQRSEVDHFDEIERFGSDNGISSIRNEFCRRILQDVEQGTPPRISALRTPTIVYISSYFIDTIESTLRELDSHAVMQQPLKLPDTWEQNEKLFWEVHVFKNRLMNSDRLASYVFSMSKPTYTKAKRKKDQATMDLLEPFGQISNKVAETNRKMRENEAELRLMELERVATTLRDSKDFKIRLAAAFALDQDESLLQEFFQAVDQSTLKRSRLADPSLGPHIKSLVDAARKNGEDVIEKALLLRTGAHWWLRGRYGMGPQAFGLLKKPESMNSVDAMFGLYMPRERPKPVSWVTDDGKISSGYERRHFHTWAVEYRELRDVGGTSRDSTKKVTAGPEKFAGTIKTFW